MNMKKNMFELWYYEYGKEFAKKSLPIDDVTDKEMRREAKKIFNSVYGITSEFMCDRLSFFQDDVKRTLNELNKKRENYLAQKKLLEPSKTEVTLIMTDLYDSYFEKKSITKEHFTTVKRYLAKNLKRIKQEIRTYDICLRKVKENIKLVESLLINY